MATSYSRSPNEYNVSQATTTARYKSLGEQQNPPPSPLDTVRGENGSSDEQDSSDGAILRSQRHKLKRRSTTSGSREHSIAREALGANLRRLSSGTTRSSDNSRERSDMLWENGGTAEEISAAALRKERRHREREQREREKERERERIKEEREREQRREEKREKKHQRSKSEKEARRAERRRESVSIAAIAAASEENVRSGGGGGNTSTAVAFRQPTAVEIPPPPPPPAYPETGRGRRESIAATPPSRAIAPPSPPRSAEDRKHHTPPPAYPEVNRRESILVQTPPQSPPDVKKSAIGSSTKTPSTPAPPTAPTAPSSTTAVKTETPVPVANSKKPVSQEVSAKSTKRSTPPSPAVEKRKLEPAPTLHSSEYQSHATKSRSHQRSTDPSSSPVAVRRTVVGTSRPSTGQNHGVSPATPAPRPASSSVRISDPPPAPPPSKASDTSTKAQVSNNIQQPVRISDPPPQPPSPPSDGSGPKRSRSPSPVSSALTTLTESSVTPVVRAQPNRDHASNYAVAPYSAGPWTHPASLQAPSARTKQPRPYSFSRAVTYGPGNTEEDLPTPRGTKRPDLRRASISHPYPQSYFEDQHRYPYPPPPAYPTAAYEWGDSYSAYSSSQQMGYENAYAGPARASDPFQYMEAPMPPRTQPKTKTRGVETIPARTSRPGHSRTKSTPSGSELNRGRYAGAMVKVRGEETESDIDLDGFYSDASAGRWTTRSVSQERGTSPKARATDTVIEDVDDRDLRDEHNERLKKEGSKSIEQEQPKRSPEPQPKKEKKREQPELPKIKIPAPQTTTAEPARIVPEVAVSEATTTSSESESSSESETESSDETGRSEHSAPQPTKRRPITTGYPMLAKTLAQSPQLQVYRRFSTLNHRILLHMQDEITELSGVLDDLDLQQTEAAIRNRRRMGSGDQRLQLLNTIAWKLNQYNQAVKAYEDSLSIPNATSQEIETFRTWLQENNPLAPAESHFLDDSNDLMALGRPKKEPSSPNLPAEPSSTPDSSPLPPTPPKKWSLTPLSTSSLQGLTIAAVLLAPMISTDATSRNCNAPKPFNWGAFLIKSFMWVLALTPVVLSLIERKGWWVMVLVIAAVASGLTLLSIT